MISEITVVVLIIILYGVVAWFVFYIGIANRKSINNPEIKNLLAQLEDKISELQSRERSYEFDNQIIDILNNIQSKRRNAIDLNNKRGVYPDSIIQSLALKYLEILESRLPKEKDSIGLTTEDAGDILRNEKEEK